MAFTATKPTGGNYTPPPAGMHIARCYTLIDLGTQKKSYQGKETGEGRKVRASFELLGEDRMEDGSPFTISKSWFLSLHEKASMRKDLESWRGRPFSREEELGFDVSKLVGAYCLLNIVQEQGEDGKDYTKISAINPLIKGMHKPAPVNPDFIFDLDAPDMEAFEKFGEKTKEIIMLSREMRARSVGSRPATMASGSSSMPPVGHPAFAGDFDDDIAF